MVVIPQSKEDMMIQIWYSYYKIHDLINYPNTLPSSWHVNVKIIQLADK